MNGQDMMPPGMAPPPPGMEQGAAPPMEQGPPPPEGQKERSVLSPAEELDADIAFGVMSSLLYSDQGSKVVTSALKTAQNPAPAIALFVAGAIEKVSKQLEQRDMAVSPNAWMAEGGAVDRLLDEIAELGEMAGAPVSPQLESMVMAEVVDQLKLMGQAEKQGRSQQPPQAGPPQADPGMAPPPAMGPPPPMGGV